MISFSSFSAKQYRTVATGLSDVTTLYWGLVSITDELPNAAHSFRTSSPTPKRKNGARSDKKSVKAIAKGPFYLSLYATSRPNLTIILQELCNFCAQS